MKNVMRNILIVSLMLSLSCGNVIAAAMPDPTPATQTDKKKAAEAKKKEAERKKKEAERKKKEADKAKAAKAKQKAAEDKKKEADKKKADAAKAQAKAQAEREKAAAERAKQNAERDAEKAKKEEEARKREEAQLRAWEKQQEELANPKTEAISYISLALRAGYSAMMDKINPQNEMLWGAGTLNRSNALQQLKGGGGAGLTLGYNLEYGHFLFETGVDFRFLNSTSAYGFQAVRYDQTYGATYTYLFDNLSETRNMMQVGVPLMFGAQFNRFYFLLGAKVGYSLWGGYSQKGRYDITVSDPALLDPYGMGIHSIPAATNTAIKFAQPEVSLAAEIGIDLDEWLQKQPDPKQKNTTKPGERLPFGREHVHYRVSLFAEYGVLNTNATPQANPVEFGANDVLVQKTNTMLAMNGDTKLNNLFVGAKFTIQFEIPGKKARPVPPPPSYTIYRVVDATTNQPLELATVETRDAKGKVALREKQIGVNGFKQKHPLGSFTASVKAEGYYPATQEFTIDEVGNTTTLTIALRPVPVFRVRVTNVETGDALPATVQVRQQAQAQPAYTLHTDSICGCARQKLAEGPQYTLHIEQIGYEALDMPIASISDSMNVALKPIKKGEVFVIKNLFFATNKTRILATSEEALNDLFMYLDRNPQIRLKIIGHTDNVGKDAANQKLSEGRANAVMADLIERGIAPERLEAEGRGETQPIDTNDTEEGRQNNRRVEIEIL